MAQQATTSAAINSVVGLANLGQVESYAAVAGAAAAASTAAIPIIGPALAVESGLTTYATVFGTFGPLSIPAFTTGGIMPTTGLALVHQGEGVLTAPVTNMLTNISNGGLTGGGTANVTTHITNQGLTDATYQAMTTRHAAHVTRTVLKGLRQANMI